MLLNSLVLLIATLQSQLLFAGTVLSQSSQQQQQQSNSNVSSPSNNSTTNSALQQQQQQQQQQQAALQLLLAPNTLATIANAAAAGNAGSGATSGAGAGVGVNLAGQPNSPNFVIKYDSKNNLAYVSILTPNQTNLHEPRIELRYQSNNPFIELSESTKINSVVAALIVNDEDPGPSGETSLFIESGNELGHFKLVSTQHSNTIQVASQLNIDLKQDYNLTIVARDHGSPPKASSVNLVIKLTQAIYKYNTLLHPDPPWDPTTNKAIFTDLMYFGAMLVVTFLTIILILILACFLTQGPNSKKGPPPRTTSTNNNLFELY